jgi:chaperone modulatory protein CbpM
MIFMEKANLIPVNNFCTHHNIEISFIDELSHFGLVEIVTIEEKPFIDAERINELERLLRLHDELHINFEGMDAITHLLRRLSDMQEEITLLKNKLRLYEEPE